MWIPNIKPIHLIPVNTFPLRNKTVNLVVAPEKKSYCITFVSRLHPPGGDHEYLFPV